MGNIALRKGNAQDFVDSFYNIVTDFYEQGWGQSFHFAPRGLNETFRESIVRYEHYLALKLGIKATDKVLDLGCGIGGPMRSIAQFTGADIVGVTINAYQVQRGNEINAADGFASQCVLRQGDFCKLAAFADNTFDKVFAIESTCHAPDRSAVYSQVYRVLKPGGKFASYEWVLNADKFDASDEAHLQMKYEIEKGNALPDLITEKECVAHFKESGFEVVSTEDVDQTSREKAQLAVGKVHGGEHSALVRRHGLHACAHVVPREAVARAQRHLPRASDPARRQGRARQSGGEPDLHAHVPRRRAKAHAKGHLNLIVNLSVEALIIICLWLWILR